MLHATLICTDETCAEETEHWAADPAELDLLICDSCGCALIAIAISTVPAPDATVAQLPRRRGSDELRRAA
ncbi:MAG: hypothetical protein QOH58_508 [Thermoleophilaceae bacterium]|nr:hypothetical protein [Thermoleophilaceae bacterium]